MIFNLHKVIVSFQLFFKCVLYAFRFFETKLQNVSTPIKENILNCLEGRGKCFDKNNLELFETVSLNGAIVFNFGHDFSFCLDQFPN